MKNRKLSTVNAIGEVAEILAIGLMRYVTKNLSTKPSTGKKVDLK